MSLRRSGGWCGISGDGGVSAGHGGRLVLRMP